MTPSDQRARNRILLVLFLGMLMGALDIAIVGPVLPDIQKTFLVGERAISWIFSLYVLFYLIGTPFMAKLSDLFGRRSVYAADISLFALGSLLVAASSRLPVPGLAFDLLLAGRAIQGFGAGGIFPVASAVIGDAFPPDQRGRALGLIGSVFGMAFLIGPVLGGIFLPAGWVWLFLINLPVAAVVLWLSLIYLPKAHPKKAAPFDWLGMIALAGALGALAYGVNNLDAANFEAGLASRSVWSFGLLAILLFCIFLLTERRAQSPVFRLGLFRSRQMRLACLLSAGAGLGEAAIVFMPALAVAAFRLPSASASYLLLPVVLAMAVGSPLAGLLLDKMGSKPVILAGTGILTSGMILLSQFSNQMVLFIGSGILIGFGLAALLGAPLRYIVLNEVPAKERSAAQGAISLFTGIGQLFSSALAGAIIASLANPVTGYNSAYLAAGIAALAMFFFATLLKGRLVELPATDNEVLPF